MIQAVLYERVTMMYRMTTLLMVPVVVSLFLPAAAAQAPESRISVQADRVLSPVSRYLTGACIEDVNHEIYGGIYSQMIFGESFQEPAPTTLKGFEVFGGNWRVQGNELHFTGSAGDKLVSDLPPFRDGEVGVDVFMSDGACSNAGLIVRVDNPGRGNDNFFGYEVALNAAAQNVRLGRHRKNWELIQDVPCEVPIGQWVALSVKLEGRTIEIFINGKSILRHEDGGAALLSGTVGLRQFQPEARYRKLWVNTGGQRRVLDFLSDTHPCEVSGMWRPIQTGDAAGTFTLKRDRPFTGQQSQCMTFVRGQGQIGVENQGLNRWGMSFVKGKPYEGLLWARAESSVELFVALENEDGSQTLAEKRLLVKAGGWQRLTFTLTPKQAANPGRLAVTLRQPGSVVLGYAFLQPGEWGRFKGLPVRRDVAEALIDQGITVLRYGGCMNGGCREHYPEYRWKKMIGPRDRRPPYAGFWYPHSTHGWGILDFMNFCEAAEFEYIPAFNMDESPRDMTDFIEYAKGSADSQWGSRRVADGHPKPYHLKYLQLGNEQHVDENYWQKFKPLAEAIWARDPEIILVVGDFAYGEPIHDPFNFSGAPITTLAAHQKILQLAKQHNREVWFDIHIRTDGPRPELGGTFSFVDALEKLADGAKHRVVILEFNAGNHELRRALANAAAINGIERDGRIPIAASANCLQPDGQNDNGWDQGLLFLNPSQVWLQPPGYITQMYNRNYLPQLVQCQVTGERDALDVSATRSEDGHTLVLKVVNPTGKSVPAKIRLSGFVPGKPVAQVTELSGPLEAVNTADKPRAVVPQQRQWTHTFKDGTTRYTFLPYSITVLRFQ